METSPPMEQDIEVDLTSAELSVLGEGTAPTPRSIEVIKPLQVEIDLGTLLVSDPNDLSINNLRNNGEEYYKSLARDNVQLLVNEIWKLPFERVDDVVVTKLPKPTFLLPREKPAPKARPLTKWQSYAKEKGITKRKKTRLVWDELVKKWVPRYGFKRAEAEHEKDWLLEVPGGADPYEDQFEKKADLKAEKVSKNELQRLRNIAKARKVDVPKTGLTSKEKPSKNELHQAMHVAKKATASLGKFQQKLPKEKPLKGTGKKRKFDPLVMPTDTEKSKNLEVLQRVMTKKPKVDFQNAVDRQVTRDSAIEASERTPKGAKFRSRSRGAGRGDDDDRDSRRSSSGGGGRGGGGARGRGGGRGRGRGRGGGGGGGRGAKTSFGGKAGGGMGRGGGGGMGRGGGGGGAGMKSRKSGPARTKRR